MQCGLPTSLGRRVCVSTSCPGQSSEDCLLWDKHPLSIFAVGFVRNSMTVAVFQTYCVSKADCRGAPAHWLQCLFNSHLHKASDVKDSATVLEMATSLPEWLKKCFRSACSVLHARCGILFYGRLQVTSGLCLSYSALAPLLLDCRWLCSSQDSIILLASRPEPGAAWALANVTHK